MKNKLALKLTLYFTTAMIILGVVTGGLFYFLFKEHVIATKKQEMRQRAARISETYTENMDVLVRLYGNNLANSRFTMYMDNITPEIVWVVDANRSLSLNKERIMKMREHHLKQGKKLTRSLPETPKEAYRNLPDHVKARVEKCFKGEDFTVEKFSFLQQETMVTVGTPILDKNQNVVAVLMLHAPVSGLDMAIMEGMKIMLISIGLAILLCFLMSMLLSWRFTRPMNKMRALVGRLADRDYGVRTEIEQDDEIGELAKKLDILAERLQLADEESQKLEMLRREFIANISHELRTPVTVIKGSLEALKDGIITEKEDVEEFYNQMYKESNFLQRLINDLLDLSRLQNTDFHIEKSEVNICDIVRDVVRSGSQLAGEKNIKVEADLDQEVYVIEADYGRLRQMLLIFIHNAIKFSPDNSTITVRLRDNLLSVIDEGCGMKPEEVEHAFDRFYKSRNEQNKTGSGLGLAIAKQIAIRHDISLYIKSYEGHGTTVNAELPVQLEEK